MRAVIRVAAAGVALTALATAAWGAPPPPPPGATIESAPPARWPEPMKAPAGAPNVLIIMTDDVGFGSSSTFGGPVPTPAFEALAREGLRYNRFHTTAICSPTRASLLTGRNPQAVNVGYVTNWSSGYDGYTSQIPKTAGTLPQVLKAHGYSTAMFGMPTVLEAAGITPPEELAGVRQQPITGISAAYTLASRDAPSRRTSQIFAMAENLAIYQGGWVAATVPKVSPWEPVPPTPIPLAERRWQLYNVDKDFSEAKDLAASNPAKLDELVGEFWKQAQAGHVLPIHTSEGRQQGRPEPNHGRTRFTYHAPVTQIAEGAAPAIVGKSFTIEADVEVGKESGGVLVAHGGRFTGYALFLDAGRPGFTFNLTPAHMTRIAASEALSPGAHRLSLTFTLDRAVPGSGGEVTLSVDGRPVGSGRVPQTFARVVSHSEGFDVGQDHVSPVDPAAYSSETSRFSGKLNRLEFTILP